VSPFARILQAAVERTPGAVGGAFAASDGEMVDHVTSIDPTDWAILTAHYGVVLANVEAALNTKHFGGAQYCVIENSTMDVVVHTVLDGYFALMALARPTCLATALAAIGDAALLLRKEMA
jgi:predicted regulator of Ras-like GTPase activity (Roadblock/LC7/MglB family)